MQAKTVALDPVAYEILRKAKREGENFSDAVKNLAGKRKSILHLAGSWSDVPEGTWQKERAKRRLADQKRAENLEKRWK